MPFDTRFCKAVGCELPLQLASLGGPIGTPELAAAVSSAGGLGMIPNPSRAEVEDLVLAARELTDGPIGVGFLMPFVDHQAVEAAGKAAHVVEFFYGDPDAKLVRLAKVHGAVVGWQVGSSIEAAAAVDAGCDFVVAQGTEAGGHIRGSQPLDDVLRESLAAVSLPVVAAGGIGSAHRVAELLRAGASAVRVGTRFVAARESNAHPDYVAALVDASAPDTVITEAFGRGWSNAPHRVLRSALLAAESFAEEVVAVVGERRVPPFAPVPPTAATKGKVAAMALYAGTSVDDVSHRQPAGEIVAELTSLVR
ncbi:MAG: nitronate monooxygenase [Gaiellales bacterium]|nr:nitronate monooxygenase [Gaiellales bacterium]